MMEKEDKTYHAVWLENEYLKVMILRSSEAGSRERTTRRIIMTLSITTM